MKSQGYSPMMGLHARKFDYLATIAVWQWKEKGCEIQVISFRHSTPILKPQSSWIGIRQFDVFLFNSKHLLNDIIISFRIQKFQWKFLLKLIYLTLWNKSYSAITFSRFSCFKTITMQFISMNAAICKKTMGFSVLWFLNFFFSALHLILVEDFCYCLG